MPRRDISAPRSRRHDHDPAAPPVEDSPAQAAMLEVLRRHGIAQDRRDDRAGPLTPGRWSTRLDGLCGSRLLARSSPAWITVAAWSAATSTLALAVHEIVEVI